MMHRVSLVSLLVCFSAPIALSAEHESPQPLRTISVTGQGEASAPPDMATVQAGVVTQATTAGEALEENNRQLQKLMDVLRARKIAAKDIQTSNFNVHPEYRHNPRGADRPEIVGYRVTNQVTLRVRNLPSLGAVLDSLVNAGSNQISGIHFGIDDATGVMNQARNRAVSDARARAELYAHAAGVKLGKVISIGEQGASVPQPQPMMRAMSAMAESAVPVATGEQEITATVNIVYELTDLE